MAKRYIGEATVEIKYRDRGDYEGSIWVPADGGTRWHFEELYAPKAGLGSGVAYDSPTAYDKMAAAAVTFASYYTTHNRGADVPDWAPPAETADAIEEATSYAMDDQGRYFVRRSFHGQMNKQRGTWRDNPRLRQLTDEQWHEAYRFNEQHQNFGALVKHLRSKYRFSDYEARYHASWIMAMKDNPQRKPRKFPHVDVRWSPVNQQWFVLWPKGKPVEQQQVLGKYTELEQAERYADSIHGSVQENPSGAFLANPTAGEVFIVVAGLALLGGVLYFAFRPKEAEAAELTPCEPAASEKLFGYLEQFAKAKGYTVFYDEHTTQLTNKPPANPKYIAAGDKAREWATKLCGFYKWTGSQWVLDTATNQEFADWSQELIIHSSAPPAPAAPSVPDLNIPDLTLHGPSAMFMV